MSTQVLFSKFRCFQQLDVQLAPLTVLIGPNDSGKSSFLGGLQWLGRAGSSPADTDYWRRQVEEGTKIATVDEGTPRVVSLHRLPGHGAQFDRPIT